MKKKRVWRYYCDFCKKSGCSSGHMKKHEARCTMNPDRECGFCKVIGDAPTPLTELIGLLPDPAEYRLDPAWKALGSEYEGDFPDAVERGLKKIQAKTDCPACTLAALRQSGIAETGAAFAAFDYKKASQEFFQAQNAQEDYR